MQIIPVDSLVPSLTAARRAASDLGRRSGVPQCVVAACELMPGKVAQVSAGFGSVLGSEVITFVTTLEPPRVPELLSHAMQQMVDTDMRFLTPFRYEGRSYQVVPLMFLPGPQDSPALYGLIDGLELIPPVFLEIVEVKLTPSTPDPFHGAQLAGLGTAAITPEATLSELNISLLSIQSNLNRLMESPAARAVISDLIEEIGDVDAHSVGAFRDLILERMQVADQKAAGDALSVVPLDLDDPVYFDPFTRPERPATLRAHGEPHELAMVCEIGASRVYRHVAERASDVLSMRVALGTDDGDPTAIIQASVFLFDHCDMANLFLPSVSDRSWYAALFRAGDDEPEEDYLALTDHAAAVWDFADAEPPEAIVRIQGFTITAAYRSDDVLRYLVDMLRWALAGHLPDVESWGFTIEAHAVTADDLAPMPRVDRKHYQEAFVSVLGAVQSSREDAPYPSDQGSAVFLLPN